MSKHRPRLLVTGASGFLGSRVVALSAGAFETAGTYFSRPCPGGIRLDIRDSADVSRLCKEIRPQVIVHTAYEKDDHEVIVEGSANVARAAAQSGARLIHLSTDALFGGGKAWYREDDTPDPLTPYGQAKSDAERAVTAACPTAVLARTSLIYGVAGDDVHSRHILDGLRAGTPVVLFTDEFRCPVLVDELARALIALAPLAHSGPLHLAGADRVSRYEFGALLARFHGDDPSRLTSATIAAAGVVRPRDCSLDSGRARAMLDIPLRGVRAVLGAEPR